MIGFSWPRAMFNFGFKRCLQCESGEFEPVMSDQYIGYLHLNGIVTSEGNHAFLSRALQIPVAVMSPTCKTGHCGRRSRVLASPGMPGLTLRTHETMKIQLVFDIPAFLDADRKLPLGDLKLPVKRLHFQK